MRKKSINDQRQTGKRPVSICRPFFTIPFQENRRAIYCALASNFFLKQTISD